MFFLWKTAFPGLDADTRTGGEYRCLHRVPKLGDVWVAECVVTHDGSMGLVSYSYLHEWLIFIANVGKYSIHGCNGWNVCGIHPVPFMRTETLVVCFRCPVHDLLS